MLSPNFYTKKLEETGEYGKFVLEPLPFSFGLSLGNALRRTLLSSQKGAGVTWVKVDGAPHFFTTIKGVKESVLELVLNLKQLRFKMKGDGPFKMTLNVKKTGKVTGAQVDGEVEVVNKDLYLAEVTDAKGKLDVEFIVEIGMGYLSSDERDRKEAGFIPVDAFFSPVKKVNFLVEEARLGRKTNLDRLILEIWTDGSVKPSETLRQASMYLSDYFGFILSGKDTPVIKKEKSEEEQKRESEDKKLYEIIIDELNLPSRVINALLRENIETVADLVKAGREKLTNLKGVGKKSIELIDVELKKMGIELA